MSWVGCLKPPDDELLFRFSVRWVGYSPPPAFHHSTAVLNSSFFVREDARI